MNSIIADTLKQEKAPWIADFVVRVGIPMTAFVGITIWALWRVDAKVEFTERNMSTHLVDTSYVIKQNDELKSIIRQNNLIMQQICVNTTKGSDNRACFPGEQR